MNNFETTSCFVELPLAAVHAKCYLILNSLSTNNCDAKHICPHTSFGWAEMMSFFTV